MKKPEPRHYTEEEVLLFHFREVSPEMADGISEHLRVCAECAGVFREYKLLEENIHSWTVPEPDAANLAAVKAKVMAQFRVDRTAAREPDSRTRKWMCALQEIWDYAMENPLPTIGYIVVGVAFASERTMDVLQLDRVLPATIEAFELLRQIF
jgi:hypothetical protein